MGGLKFVDKFAYLDSNISSTESDVNICLVKAWTAIHMLSILWMSDISDKIKLGFFQAMTVNTTVWMHHIDANKTHGEKARWEIYKNAVCYFEQILEATPQKTTVQILTSHLANQLSKMNKTCGSLLEKQG